jgi:cell division protein FtsN
MITEIPVRRTMSDPQPESVGGGPAPTSPAPTQIGKEDSVLASIVNGITIPAEELEVLAKAPEPVVEPVRTAAPARIAEIAAKPVAAKPKPEPAKPATKTVAKVDPKTKKAEPKKPEPKKPDPATSEPSRTWVQVAGGANEAALTKAWKAVVTKAPAAMKGKSGWSSPLRATNRVLAGPFKNSAEAQSFVNTLGKAGVSAFVFTSEAGQKITRLTLK